MSKEEQKELEEEYEQMKAEDLQNYYSMIGEGINRGESYPRTGKAKFNPKESNNYYENTWTDIKP